MKKLLPILVILASLTAAAQNPVILGQYSADPTARVFDGKLYLYPSHDIINPLPDARPAWFAMADYHVFSSDNLTDWTDHGVILGQENVPWGNPTAYSMWAPDCVCKNGKYYFFFPDAPAEGFGFKVGIAVAESPTGPFTAQPEPVKGVMGIDPCVLLDDDGSAYLYWSGMGLRGAKLSDDMLSVVGESVLLDSELPKGFKEGPFIFKRNGKYYLTYPWVREKTETLAYAMSDKPLGPYKFVGLIMEQSPTGCWTNHHSLVEFEGQWYLFYHHNDCSVNFDKNRSVRIDRVTFNEDGTILPVAPTLRGVGNTAATAKIQLDRYTNLFPVASYVDFLNPSEPFGGWYAHLGCAGSSLRYDRVQFDSESVMTIRYRSDAGAEVVFRTAGDDGVELVGTKLPRSRKWKEVRLDVLAPQTGLKDLELAVKSGCLDVDWVQFSR